MSDRGTALEAHEVVESWREEFAHHDSPALEWVTLAEAEKVADVSRSTLRAWFRSGQLPSRLEPGPHGPQRLVPVEAVLDKARRSPARGRARPRKPEALDEHLVPLIEAVIARAEDRATAAETALRAALERAAAAEAELRVLRDGLPSPT
jgi:hypothetical protein